MASKKKTPLPSEKIAEFLAWVDEIQREYKEAEAGRKEEENRLQDLLHDVELAVGKEEQRRADTALRNSRRNRRVQKDRAMEIEYIYNFFQDGANRKTLNGIRQLLGNQRKREEYVHGERHYNYRMRSGEGEQ